MTGPPSTRAAARPIADAYREDIREREAVPQFYDRYGEYKSVCLLGTATHKRRSHVEVLQQMLEAATKG